MNYRRLLAFLAPLPLLHFAFACVGDDPVAGGQPQADASTSGSSSSGNSSSSGASGDAGDGSTTTTPIQGLVVDSVGTPVLDATLRVAGLAKTVKTDATGAFTLDAPPSYDLVVVHPSVSTTSGLATLALTGLKTRQPRVQIVNAAKHKATSTTVTAAGVQGGGLGANGLYSYLFVPGSGVRAEAVNRAFFTGPTNVMTAITAFSWLGDATLSGTVHAFRLTNDAFDLPVAFQGYGTSSFSIGEASTTTHSVDIANIVPDKRVAGTITYGDSTPSAFVYYVRVKGTSALRFSGRAFAPTTFDLPFPNNSLMRAAVVVTGKRGFANATAWRVNIAGGTTNVAVPIPPELVVKEPATGATSVDTTTQFAWDAPGAPFGSYHVAVTCRVASQVEYSLVVITTQTSVKLPDPAALGAPIPSAKSCSWTVTAMQAPTTDDTVGATGWARYVSADESLEDGASSSSASRDFTTR